jgi:hypothetical protein
MTFEDRSQKEVQSIPYLLPQPVEWYNIRQPGAYVEVNSGNLYRIPCEAVPGTFPIIMIESISSPRFVKISENPFIERHKARMRCSEQNIQTNF